MRLTFSAIAVAIGLTGVFVFGPASGAGMCPANGQPYKISGVVKNVDTTKDGQTFYNVVHTRCSSTEDNTIAVYPSAPVAACLAGKHAVASGAYNMSCLDDTAFAGGVCVASLSNATLTCK